MKRFIWLLLILMGCMTACATGGQTVSRISFPEAEYAQLNTVGNAVIHGKVFLEARGGGRLISSGSRVILNPVTSYSSQWYNTARRKLPMEDPDLRLMKYIQEVTTDDKGQFEFKNIPPGEYFLITPIVWEDPTLTMTNNPVASRGRFIVRRIIVNDGDDLSISLNLRINDYEDNTLINNDYYNLPKWTDMPY